MEEKIRGFFESGVLGEVMDVVSSIEELADVAVDKRGCRSLEVDAF